MRRKFISMTVSNVYGCGSQRGYTETFRGGKIPIRLLPKVKLEIAVNDNFVEPAVDAIRKAARSEPGRIGDGKIFVLPLDECYRIRTGETGQRRHRAVSEFDQLAGRRTHQQSSPMSTDRACRG